MYLTPLPTTQVRLLLEAGCDPNVAIPLGVDHVSSPLIMLCALKPRPDIIALLVKHGANIEAPAEVRTTPNALR